MKESLRAVISGSFKYKPEIDTTHEILEENGVAVLEPTKGWLIMPQFELVEYYRHGRIRPLPTEQGLATRQIEDRFLRAMERVDLVYIMNVEGYIGETTAFEIGYALALGKPMYADQPLNMEIEDLEIRKLLLESVVVLPPEKVADHFQKNNRKF